MLKELRAKVLAALTPEPEIKEEYVGKVVYLLRRDFNTTEQNEIIMSIIKKISEKRHEDMTDMERRYATLQKDTSLLENSVSI